MGRDHAEIVLIFFFYKKKKEMGEAMSRPQRNCIFAFLPQGIFPHQLNFGIAVKLSKHEEGEGKLM